MGFKTVSEAEFTPKDGQIEGDNLKTPSATDPPQDLFYPNKIAVARLERLGP
jgi:hypothetical protein